MRKFMLVAMRLIAFVKFVVSVIKSERWEKHYFATMLVALVVSGCLIVEIGKRHDAELERQRVQELLEIERDERYNDSLVN